MDTNVIWFVALGLVAGVASGLLGIGGAILLIPALVFLFGFSQARAQGTSIAALVPPVGILAAIQYYRNDAMDVRAALLIALGFVFGGLGGATLVPYISQIWLKRLFAFLILYVAARMLWSTRK